MKILACDDDHAVLSMVRFKLSRENLREVITAEDSRKAITLLGSHDFDLIMTEIHMPFNSGLELGADDFVAKPFSLGELVLRVKRLIR